MKTLFHPCPQKQGWEKNIIYIVNVTVDNTQQQTIVNSFSSASDNIKPRYGLELFTYLHMVFGQPCHCLKRFFSNKQWLFGTTHFLASSGGYTIALTNRNTRQTLTSLMLNKCIILQQSHTVTREMQGQGFLMLALSSNQGMTYLQLCHVLNTENIISSGDLVLICQCIIISL